MQYCDFIDKPSWHWRADFRVLSISETFQEACSWLKLASLAKYLTQQVFLALTVLSLFFKNQRYISGVCQILC